MILKWAKLREFWWVIQEILQRSNLWVRTLYWSRQAWTALFVSGQSGHVLQSCKTSVWGDLRTYRIGLAKINHLLSLELKYGVRKWRALKNTGEELKKLYLQRCSGNLNTALSSQTRQLDKYTTRSSYQRKYPTCQIQTMMTCLKWLLTERCMQKSSKTINSQLLSPRELSTSRTTTKGLMWKKTGLTYSWETRLATSRFGIWRQWWKESV